MFVADFPGQVSAHLLQKFARGCFILLHTFHDRHASSTVNVWQKVLEISWLGSSVILVLKVDVVVYRFRRLGMALHVRGWNIWS
jgi:hypothetical protein